MQNEELEVSKRKGIVALALLTREQVKALGDNFELIYPIDETPCFGALLQAIDEADREIWRERDKADSEPR